MAIAAKAIKYGGMSEEEAWKLVTINPAKLLHLDDKIGSIKVGKDADVVLSKKFPHFDFRLQLSVFRLIFPASLRGVGSIPYGPEAAFRLHYSLSSVFCHLTSVI